MNTLGKISTALVSGLLMAFPAATLAESTENQILYISLPKLMEESESGKEKRAELESLQNAKTADIQAKAASFQKVNTELEKARKDLVAKRSGFTPAELKQEEKKVTELERKVKDLENKLQLAYQDAESDLKGEWMRVTEQLYKEQAEIIAEWAKEKKAYAVVDKETGRVLYCRNTSDMTDELLKVANKKHTKKTVVAKNTTAVKVPAVKVA